jgi:hypothetical protein
MDREFSVVLQMARKKRQGKDEVVDAPFIPTFIIHPQDMIQVMAVDVDTTFAERGVLSDLQGITYHPAVSSLSLSAV